MDRVGIESGFLIRWSVNLEMHFTDILLRTNFLSVICFELENRNLRYNTRYHTIHHTELSGKKTKRLCHRFYRKQKGINIIYHPPGSRHKVLHSASVGSKILCFLNLTPGRGNEHKLESESEAIEPLQRPTHHLWMIPPTQRKNTDYSVDRELKTAP